jgi:hypothetical protein
MHLFQQNRLKHALKEKLTTSNIMYRLILSVTVTGRLTFLTGRTRLSYLSGCSKCRMSLLCTRPASISSPSHCAIMWRYHNDAFTHYLLPGVHILLLMWLFTSCLLQINCASEWWNMNGMVRRSVSCSAHMLLKKVLPAIGVHFAILFRLPEIKCWVHVEILRCFQLYYLQMWH